jgi:hypothetical protein
MASGGCGFLFGGIIGHGFPQALRLVGFIDGDGEGLCRKILFKPLSGLLGLRQFLCSDCQNEVGCADGVDLRDAMPDIARTSFLPPVRLKTKYNPSPQRKLG